MAFANHSLRTLPPEVSDRSAWYGPDLLDRRDWIEQFSQAEIVEVTRAVRELARSSRDLTSLSRADFPLPTLGPRLRQLVDEVLNGRGFVLIRTLPIERWTKREAAIAF